MFLFFCFVKESEYLHFPGKKYKTREEQTIAVMSEQGTNPVSGIIQLCQNCSFLQQQVTHLTQTNEQLKDYLQKQQSDITRQNTQIDTQNNNNQNETSINNLQTSINSLRISILHLQTSINSLRISINSLRISILHLQTSINKQSIRQLEKDIQTVQNTIAELQPFHCSSRYRTLHAYQLVYQLSDLLAEYLMVDASSLYTLSFTDLYATVVRADSTLEKYLNSINKSTADILFAQSRNARRPRSHPNLTDIPKNKVLELVTAQFTGPIFETAELLVNTIFTLNDVLQISCE